jgi:HPt (histidine-containing phosphotransfer) domain-containing protein
MSLLFDAAQLSDRVMGNEELARRIVRRFLEDLPSQIARLEQAVRDGDAAGVRLIAHSMKGAAAGVSAEEIRAASWKLERQAREGDLSAAADGLREISESFERARPVMESFCQITSQP